MQIGSIKVGKKVSAITASFKANVVIDRQGHPQRFLFKQVFTFKRRNGVLTREPEKVLALGCPACGSKAEPEVTGRCPSCGKIAGGGRFDWQVTSISAQRPIPVSDPVGMDGGFEVGTDSPDIFEPHLAAHRRALMQRDPSFSWNRFRVRTRAVFMKLQEGWTKRDESILRPYELDVVYDAHRIWLVRYREQRVRNVLKDINIDKWVVVKIEHDTWFDAITVRIFATMLDYHETDDGKLISGSRSRPRSFSEYFTLVRRARHKKRGTADPLKCPQCGAPLDRVSHVGVCGYCDTRITAGDFDWVLAQITQDEEYKG
jgi:hypothetical protein